MSPPTVEVDGSVPASLIDVSYSNVSGDQIGTANITVANTDFNRSLFSPGDGVEIFEDGSKEWSGEVVGKPSNQSKRNLTLTVEAETLAGQAEYGKVNRPFIEMSRAEIVRQSIDSVVEPYTRTKKISHCDSTTDWSTTAPIFELTNDSKGINEFGNDTLFVGFTEGDSGVFDVVFDDVPANAAPGRQVLNFETRLLVNNTGDVFDVSVELVDEDGVSYLWDVPVLGMATWDVYELPVENANITTGGDPLTLRYTFEAKSPIPDDRAAAIDMARTTPFRLETRGLGLSHDVDDTDDQISRRVDDSILTTAHSCAVEAGANIYVNEDDTLIFETGGDVTSPYTIDDSPDTGIVSVDVDRDFDVVNRVTVQGKDDLQATFEDTSSIQFYNEDVPKNEPINDGALRTRDQLAARARGFLRENAWEDSAISFTLYGSKWRNVRPGQSIPIEWSPEGISGTFTVDEVSRTVEGYTKIGATGQTEI